ncbi:MAG: hypothetical protein PHR73_07865 [Candidatus Omnitrophica bacterium]|nr:hypothetical protein [Candidatus Omnitrophota bacterium]
MFKRILAAVVILCFFSASLPLSLANEIPSIKEPKTGSYLDENVLDYYAQQCFVTLRNAESLAYRINEIAKDIADSLGKSQLDFQVRIINDPAPLVFSFPPAYLYVSSGALDLLTNDDELAAVLAPCLARLINNYQLKTYDDISRKINKQSERSLKANRQNLFIGLGLFLGGVVLSVFTLGIAPLAIGAVSGAVVVSGNKGFKAYNLPKKRVFLNRMAAQLQNPSGNYGFLIVFFKEIYEGYDASDELKSEAEGLVALKKAGYNASVYVSAMEKLLKVEKEYLAKGYASNLFLAQPGLEAKINYAKEYINKN